MQRKLAAGYNRAMLLFVFRAASASLPYTTGKEPDNNFEALETEPVMTFRHDCSRQISYCSIRKSFSAYFLTLQGWEMFWATREVLVLR